METIVGEMETIVDEMETIVDEERLKEERLKEESLKEERLKGLLKWFMTILNIFFLLCDFSKITECPTEALIFASNVLHKRIQKSLTTQYFSEGCPLTEKEVRGIGCSELSPLLSIKDQKPELTTLAFGFLCTLNNFIHSRVVSEFETGVNALIPLGKKGFMTPFIFAKEIKSLLKFGEKRSSSERNEQRRKVISVKGPLPVKDRSEGSKQEKIERGRQYEESRRSRQSTPHSPALTSSNNAKTYRIQLNFAVEVVKSFQFPPLTTPPQHYFTMRNFLIRILKEIGANWDLLVKPILHTLEPIVVCEFKDWIAKSIETKTCEIFYCGELISHIDNSTKYKIHVSQQRRFISRIWNIVRDYFYENQLPELPNLTSEILERLNAYTPKVKPEKEVKVAGGGGGGGVTDETSL